MRIMDIESLQFLAIAQKYNYFQIRLFQVEKMMKQWSLIAPLSWHNYFYFYTFHMNHIFM